DFGKVGDEYFLAQEYILGRDLGRLTARAIEKQQRALPPTTVLYAARETRRALEYAHTKLGEARRPRARVPHDISHTNILVEAPPGPCAAIVRKALEIDPSKRYQTATEFGAAIATHAAGGAAEAGALMSTLFAGDFRAEEARFAAAIPNSGAVDARHTRDFQ